MIAITGLGAVCGLGDDPGSVFDAVLAGRSAIAPHPGWPDAPPLAGVPGGPHLGSDLADHVVRQALGGADPSRMGLVGASTAADLTVGEPAYAAVLRGADPSPDYFWTQLADRPTAVVGRRLGFGGPRLTVSSACTSGASAVGVAADWIRAGRVDAAVAFGVDALCGTTVYGFRALGLIAPDGCRPFDLHRDGMTVGEGAAAVLLESEAHARARGATPLAWLTGYGSAGDAVHMTAPDPAGGGARRAIAAAVRGRAVDHVNAHATGTALNDAMEAAVLADLFPGVPVSATKGATGHTLAACGALELVLTVLTLARQTLPPTARLREPMPGLDVVTAPRPAPVRRALSVNFAFGGSCAALLVERA